MLGTMVGSFYALSIIFTCFEPLAMKNTNEFLFCLRCSFLFFVIGCTPACFSSSVLWLYLKSRSNCCYEFVIHIPILGIWKLLPIALMFSFKLLCHFSNPLHKYCIIFLYFFLGNLLGPYFKTISYIDLLECQFNLKLTN